MRGRGLAARTRTHCTPAARHAHPADVRLDPAALTSRLRPSTTGTPSRPPGRPTLQAHAYSLLRTILGTAVDRGLITTANPAKVRGRRLNQPGQEVPPGPLGRASPRVPSPGWRSRSGGGRRQSRGWSATTSTRAPVSSDGPTAHNSYQWSTISGVMRPSVARRRTSAGCARRAGPGSVLRVRAASGPALDLAVPSARHRRNWPNVVRCWDLREGLEPSAPPTSRRPDDPGTRSLRSQQLPVSLSSNVDGAEVQVPSVRTGVARLVAATAHPCDLPEPLFGSSWRSSSSPRLPLDAIALCIGSESSAGVWLCPSTRRQATVSD